jgi:threonine synthase
MTTGPTIAKGLATGKPGKKGEWVLRILRQWEGEALDVKDDEVEEAQRLMVETEGLWSGPTGASALAALCKGVRENRLDPDATFVCLITETGLTSPYPPVEPHATEASETGIREALAQLTL